MARPGSFDVESYYRRADAKGRTSQATAAITQNMGIEHTVAPMSDSPVHTIVHNDQGDLAFQHYFVRELRPKIGNFSFDGIANAKLNPHSRVVSRLAASFARLTFRIGRLLLHLVVWRTKSLPVIAVSPIVGGIAIKGNPQK